MKFDWFSKKQKISFFSYCEASSSIVNGDYLPVIVYNSLSFSRTEVHSKKIFSSKFVLRKVFSSSFLGNSVCDSFEFTKCFGFRFGNDFDSVPIRFPYQETKVTK